MYAVVRESSRGTKVLSGLWIAVRPLLLLALAVPLIVSLMIVVGGPTESIFVAESLVVIVAFGVPFGFASGLYIRRIVKGLNKGKALAAPV